MDDRDAAPPDPERAALKERPEPPSRRRVSRRAVLTGGVTGLLGLGAGYAAGTADAGETPPTGLAAAPLVLAAPDRRVPHGIVRADLRAFAAGADGDFQPALARALAAADAVYVPPGIWPVRRPVEVGRGKVLWSDAVKAAGRALFGGAVIQAATSMRAAVLMTGWAATLSGLTANGADVADAAIEFASNGLLLDDAVGMAGVRYALKATGDECRIWGGQFRQSQSTGTTVYQKGADLIMWGSLVTRGSVPLRVDGSGGVFGVMHVVGIGGEPVRPSVATVQVTGQRNLFVDLYYDTAGGGPNLLLNGIANGNRFVGMTIRNRWAAGRVPVIRVDARAGMVVNNFFDDFMTDAGGGRGWTYLLEQTGDPSHLIGNALGDGHADRCAALWNTRPTIVGDISTNGLLTRNAGTATLPAGVRSFRISHGLAGRPRSISLDLSRGAAPRPDISLDGSTISLTWRRPPGALDLYWRAEL